MYRRVVVGIDKDGSRTSWTRLKEHAREVENELDLSADDLQELVETFKAIYQEQTGGEFPQDPREQLAPGELRCSLVERGRARRSLPADGRDHRPKRHRGQRPCRWSSATGRGHRAPACASRATRPTATNEFYGEYLINAQGEDVVAGIRTPEPISASCGEEMPEVYDQLLRDPRDAREALPRHAGPRVHRRGRDAVHAADPYGEADGGGGARRSRWRWSRRG